jgi:hypothetical protein
MAHEIVPRGGECVSAAEVARRLGSEFVYVIADKEAGAAAAIRAAEWIENANPAVFLGRHHEALERARRLRDLAPGEAVVIKFGDDKRNLTSVTVLPNERLKFGYAGLEEEQAMRGVVARCAKALDADVVLI